MRRNYEYKSANDGGGGPGGGLGDDEGPGDQRAGRWNGDPGVAARGMKMTPGIQRLPSFNFN